jgi:hypothetical protein
MTAGIAQAIEHLPSNFQTPARQTQTHTHTHTHTHTNPSEDDLFLWLNARPSFKVIIGF